MLELLTLWIPHSCQTIYSVTYMVLAQGYDCDYGPDRISVAPPLYTRNQLCPRRLFPTFRSLQG